MDNNLFKKTYNHTPNRMAQENWIYLTAISHYKHEADPIPFYRNYFEGYQMFYTLSGKGWLDYQGNYQYIIPGTLVCIDLQKKHGMGAVPGHIWEHYWVTINGKAFEDIYNSFFLKTNLHHLKKTDLVKKLFEELFYLKNANYIFFDFKSMSNILQIVSEILTNEGPSSQNVSNTQLSSIQKAVLYIKENYMENIDLNDLSNVAGYSSYHFSRIFKMHTGFSPTDYVIKTRLERSKDLLLKSNLSIQVVAENSGFHSVNYFIKVFKEWEGITPARYKNLPNF